MHQSRTRVGDQMTSKVVTVDEYASVKDVADLIVRHGFNAVPVVSRLGRLTGVISEADLILRQDVSAGARSWFESSVHHAHRDRARGLRAREIMTRGPITVRPEDSCSAVAELMHHKHLKSLPVVDDEGFLVGIISRCDLIRILTRSDPEIADAVREELREASVDLTRVGIEVDRGVATISGWVGRPDDARRLRRVVRQAEGVIGVRLWLNAASRLDP
jgi:CBS-domain-containing membrane protein